MVAVANSRLRIFRGSSISSRWNRAISLRGSIQGPGSIPEIFLISDVLDKCVSKIEHCHEIFDPFFGKKNTTWSLFKQA